MKHCFYICKEDFFLERQNNFFAYSYFKTYYACMVGSSITLLFLLPCTHTNSERSPKSTNSEQRSFLSASLLNKNNNKILLKEKRSDEKKRDVFFKGTPNKW